MTNTIKSIIIIGKFLYAQTIYKGKICNQDNGIYGPKGP